MLSSRRAQEEPGDPYESGERGVRRRADGGCTRPANAEIRPGRYLEAGTRPACWGLGGLQPPEWGWVRQVERGKLWPRSQVRAWTVWRHGRAPIAHGAESKRQRAGSGSFGRPARPEEAAQTAGGGSGSRTRGTQPCRAGNRGAGAAALPADVSGIQPQGSCPPPLSLGPGKQTHRRPRITGYSRKGRK